MGSESRNGILGELPSSVSNSNATAGTPDTFQLWNWPEFYKFATQGPSNDRPYYAAGGPPNSHNAAYYSYPDGRMEIRSGGTLAWRNNNPGNVRSVTNEIGMNVAYAPKNPNGARQAILPDEQAGQDAQQRLLFDAPRSPYPRFSIADAVTRYAPPSENPTAAMIAALVRAVGVPSTTILSRLNPAQRAAFMAEERRWENSKPGTVETINWGQPDAK
ncbi:MAG: hypothetical protein HY243_17880 [Proteobacteria bacterium]|nr:hypothetical protein [Pseudomonadota bacterium]